MRHARVVHLQRQEVHARVRLGGRHDVLALPGADLNDKRVGIAPCPAHIIRVKHEALAHIQGAFAGIDVEQIIGGIVVPRTLQPGIQTPGPAHERKHFMHGMPALPLLRHVTRRTVGNILVFFIVFLHSSLLSMRSGQIG